MDTAHAIRQQGLPNECLLIVIECLKDDLRTLHSLLTVSRFFFHATIPWILNKPFETWSMGSVRARFITNREKFMALLLASILRHYPYETLTRTHHNCHKSPAEELLRGFGLQLHDLEHLHQFPLLQECLESNVPPKNKTRMTIDYSTLFTHIVKDDRPIPYINFDQFIRLRRLPYTMEDRFGDLGMEDMVLQVEDDLDQDRDEDLVHTLEQQTEVDYRAQVKTAFQRLLIHSNAENLLTLHWDLSKDDFELMLPLATRMRRLRTLSIVWGTIVSKESLGAAVQFISTHRASFPRQYLHFELNTRWIDNLLNRSLAGMDPGFIRAKMAQYIRPKMLLYTAQEQPSSMDGSLVLNFFQDVLKNESTIQLDQVKEFVDDDEYRQLYAYSTTTLHRISRQKFLESCTNLHSIQETVSHREMFAWAAMNKRERLAILGLDPKDYHLRQYSLPPIVLPKLSRLFLSSNQPTSKIGYHGVLACANDALEAFSETLRSIELQASMELTADTLQTDSWISNQQVPRCTGLFLPNCLPHLTELRIHFGLYSGLDALDGLTAGTCPVLETLSVSMGSIKSLSDESDYAILIEEENNQTRPPKWTLFQRWDLPRLKYLDLKGAVALRFDYDSLATMPRLETLHLSCTMNNLLKKHLGRIPRLSHHLGLDDKTPKWTLEQRSGLPRLRSLTMSGLPASVFELGWLEKMPVLEWLTVEMDDACSNSVGSFAQPLSDPSGFCPRRDIPSAKRSSYLKSVYFSGPWIRTEEAMRSLSEWIRGPKLEDLILRRVPPSVASSAEESRSSNSSESGNDDDDDDVAVVTTSEGKTVDPIHTEPPVASDFELFRALLDMIEEPSGSLKRVQTDCDLTEKEVEILNLEVLNSGDYKCAFRMAENVYLVRRD